MAGLELWGEIVYDKEWPPPRKPDVEGTAKQGQGRRISVSNHLRLNLALVRKPGTRGCRKRLLTKEPSSEVSKYQGAEAAEQSQRMTFQIARGWRPERNETEGEVEVGAP